MSTQITGVVGEDASLHDTNIFNAAAPTSWADLDLSSVTGANQSIVCLSVKQSTSDLHYGFKRKGLPDAMTANSIGTTKATVYNGNTMRVIVETNASGVVEWKQLAGVAATTEIDIIWSYPLA